MKLVLHNYWRSSASYRVRIGLELKGLAYEYVAVNLLEGAQLDEAFRAKNPMAQVPTLEISEGGATHAISQSLPILEYLDERFPDPAILPRDPYLRAKARGIAEAINSGIQPLHNLAVTKRLVARGVDALAWTREVVTTGFAGVAGMVRATAGAFCVGDAPTIADCCLIPQLASARRFGVDVSAFSELLAIEQRCLALPAFAAAAPDRQPDAVPAKA